MTADHRDGKVILRYQVHCAGGCGVYHEDTSRTGLLASLRSREGREHPWELVGGRWYCGGCVGWTWKRVRVASRDRSARRAAARA